MKVLARVRYGDKIGIIKEMDEFNRSKITAIEAGRRRGRFNIYVDGAFTAAAGEKVIADLRLRVGLPFSAESLERITGEEEKRKALESAMRLLEARPRAAKEIEQRLRLKGYEDEMIAETLATLRRLELIDDAQFARQWIESRLRARPKGTRALRTELAQKGIARDEIDEAVAAVTPETEIESARRALRAKVGRSPLPSDPEERQAEKRRLIGFLQRRGFGWDSLKAAVGEVFSGMDENEDLEGSEE